MSKKIYYNDNRKHLLYKNDYIELYSTGHYWDFCWYIVNRNDKDINIHWNEWDRDTKIKKNNWIGIFDEYGESDFIRAIMNENVEYGEVYYKWG